MSHTLRFKQIAWIAIVLILTSTRSQIPVSTVNWKATTITSQRFSNRNGEINGTDFGHFSPDTAKFSTLGHHQILTYVNERIISVVSRECDYQSEIHIMITLITFLLIFLDLSQHYLHQFSFVLH